MPHPRLLNSRIRLRGSRLLLLLILVTLVGCGRWNNRSRDTEQGGQKTDTPTVPEWVTVTPESDLEYDRFVVHGELYATPGEARARHDSLYQQQLRGVLDPQLAEVAGSSDAVKWIDYDIQQLQSQIKQSPLYLERKKTSVGTMYQYHSLVELHRGVRDKLRALWLTFEGIQRSLQLGIYWLAVVGGLGIVTLQLGSKWAHRTTLSGALGIGLAASLVALSNWVIWI